MITLFLGVGATAIPKQAGLVTITIFQSGKRVLTSIRLPLMPVTDFLRFRFRKRAEIFLNQPEIYNPLKTKE